MAETRAELSELSIMTMEALKVPELPKRENVTSDMKKLLTIDRILEEIDKRGILDEGIDVNLLNTTYDQKKKFSVHMKQEYLKILNQKREQTEAEQREEKLQSKRMKKAEEMKYRAELRTAETKRIKCARSWNEEEFRKRQEDVRLKLEETTKEIRIKVEEQFPLDFEKREGYSKRRQPLNEQLIKEEQAIAEQKACDQLEALQREEQAHREQMRRLDKQIEEATRKIEEIYKTPPKGSDKKLETTLEVIKKAELEALSDFEEQQRGLRAWYQQQRKGYLDQRAVERAEAEEKIRVRSEAQASWRKKERKAPEIKHERIKEADRNYEERRIADRQKLEEKRLADAQKRADKALAAAQKRKEAVLAEERRMEEQRLELERKKEQKRREEEERRLEEKLMAEERKLQEQKFIEKRKQLEAQAALLSQCMEDYVLQARLEQEEQKKAVTITDKWKHMQSVVFRSKTAKAKWQKAKIAVMFGVQLKNVKNEQMLS